MEVKIVISGILLALGCFLMVVAAVGLVRFPDFYSRIHPAGKCDTLGQSFVLLGLVVHTGFSLVSVKLLIIMAFIYLANPMATHFIAKAAYRTSLEPWEKARPGVLLEEQRESGEESGDDIPLADKINIRGIKDHA